LRGTGRGKEEGTGGRILGAGKVVREKEEKRKKKKRGGRRLELSLHLQGKKEKKKGKNYSRFKGFPKRGKGRKKRQEPSTSNQEKKRKGKKKKASSQREPANWKEKKKKRKTNAPPCHCSSFPMQEKKGGREGLAELPQLSNAKRGGKGKKGGRPLCG